MVNDSAAPPNLPADSAPMITMFLLQPVASNVPCFNPKGHGAHAGKYFATCYRYPTKPEELTIPALH